jgi:hypothetical protein
MIQQRDNLWSKLVDRRLATGAKWGFMAENELRVLTKGNRATTYINGEQFASPSRDAPEEASHFGLYGSSGSVPVTWAGRRCAFAIRLA